MGLVNSYLDVDSKCIWGCTSLLTSFFFFKFLSKIMPWVYALVDQSELA